MLCPVCKSTHCYHYRPSLTPWRDVAHEAWKLAKMLPTHLPAYLKGWIEDLKARP